MGVFLVGYDLNKQPESYAELTAKLKSFGTWWHGLDSTWFIRAERTAAQLRDELMTLVDRDDELVVMDVTGDSWGSYGLSKELSDWLVKNV